MMREPLMGVDPKGCFRHLLNEVEHKASCIEGIMAEHAEFDPTGAGALAQEADEIVRHLKSVVDLVDIIAAAKGWWPNNERYAKLRDRYSFEEGDSNG